MSDQDDFPRCETCEHWHTPQLHCGYGEHKALCGKGNSDGHTQSYTSPDFGCILHSALQDDE